jgi:metal-responsive CopG/Arc/MetJ family transcriptional regulator
MAEKEQEDRIFVNTPMEAELVEKLDEMVEANESTRAQFIRLLIKKNYEEFTHIQGIRQRVEPKIKQVVR